MASHRFATPKTAAQVGTEHTCLGVLHLDIGHLLAVTRDFHRHGVPHHFDLLMLRTCGFRAWGGGLYG